MSKKDELLKENSDLAISDFDKELSYDAVKGIISAKRSYNKAKKANDKEGMTEANAYANSIRKTHGGFTGGSDGSAYYPYMSFSKKERPEYENEYSAETDSIYNEIKNRDDFSYDPYSDPVFELYKKVYETSGDNAYERALSSNSAKTGGIANTNAISAASQAKAYYNMLLAEKAAELYDDAYERYLGETEELYNMADLLRSLEKDAYQRHLGSKEAFENDRDFEYELYRTASDDVEDEIRYARDFDYQKSRDDMYDSKWYQSFDYERERDKVEDDRWQEEMDYQRGRDMAEDERRRLENSGAGNDHISGPVNSGVGNYISVDRILPLINLIGYDQAMALFPELFR